MVIFIHLERVYCCRVVMASGWESEGRGLKHLHLQETFDLIVAKQQSSASKYF